MQALRHRDRCSLLTLNCGSLNLSAPLKKQESIAPGLLGKNHRRRVPTEAATTGLLLKFFFKSLAATKSHWVA